MTKDKLIELFEKEEAVRDAIKDSKEMIEISDNTLKELGYNVDK